MNMDFSRGFLILVILASAVMLVKPRSRFWLLRLIIYITCFIVLLNPDINIDRDKSLLPSVGIFVDTSSSMLLEDRSRNAQSALKQILKKLNKNAKVKVFKFTDSAIPVAADEIYDISAGKGPTDISAAIRKNIFNARVIITDGQYNKGNNPEAMRELSLAPVYTVGIGSSLKVPDLSIEDLKEPGIAFKNQTVQIQFNIKNRSRYQGRTISYLKLKKNIVARKVIPLDSKEYSRVTMEFTPEKIGIENYTLVVDGIPREINMTNNRKNFQIQVNRRKIRILYVTGQPSWEYSFFRRLVKSDPQIELVTFMILRNPGNITIVPENELSLIHFPAREMFTEEIFEFDLLFYDNFAYHRFFPKSYLVNVKNFVLKGGGFIMFGGEDSFERGRYIDSPIYDILPVTIDKKTSAWIKKKVKALPAGPLTHPVINIADDEDKSRSIWNEMPPQESYDPGLKKRADSAELLVTPDNIPLLAVRDAGKGRAMVFNSNSTWRWCLGLAGKGKTPFYYNRFWYKVIRYMVHSGALSNVQVFPGKDSAGVGERVNINIKVLDRYWQPLNKGRVKMNVTDPSGKRIPMGLISPSGTGGWYHSSIKVTHDGLYTVSVTAYDGNVLIGEAEASFSGVLVDRELSETSLNSDLLENIAVKSGGKYYTIENLEPDKITDEIKRILRGRKHIKKYSWHHWSVFLFLAVILVFEWLIRRLKGWA